MKPSRAFSLSLLSAGLALSLASARADDTDTPPVPPQSPATTPADGQTTPPPHRRHMRAAFVLGELTAKLSLTPDEQKAVGALIADNESQMKALREDDSLSKEDKRAKMRGITETTRGAIRAALTPDQQKIFDTLPTRGERGGPPAAAPQGTPPAPTATPAPAT
jgi:hypothetical protein